eukprot:1677688-Rhodomonas_salina.1
MERGESFEVISTSPEKTVAHPKYKMVARVRRQPFLATTRLLLFKTQKEFPVTKLPPRAFQAVQRLYCAPISEQLGFPPRNCTRGYGYPGYRESSQKAMSDNDIVDVPGYRDPWVSGIPVQSQL